MINRILNLDNTHNDSAFVWGARQVGKTTLIRETYPNAAYYDLLQAKDFERLQRNPSFIIQELIAYLGYNEKEEQLSYWRTSSGYEVDVILGNGHVAIEIKSVEEIQSRHLKGLKAF